MTQWWHLFARAPGSAQVLGYARQKLRALPCRIPLERFPTRSSALAQGYGLQLQHVVLRRYLFWAA